LCHVHKAQTKELKKFEVTRTEAEWKKMLTSEQYTITRKQGTEDLSKMLITIIMKMERIHVLAVTFPCLGSDTKFESGTGWPSFYKPLVAKNVEVSKDGALVWSGTKYIVLVVVPTWGMCLMMVLNQQAYAIA
jgi:peptide-methionine (R)-S-oxide reductase